MLILAEQLQTFLPGQLGDNFQSGSKACCLSYIMPKFPHFYIRANLKDLSFLGFQLFMIFKFMLWKLRRHKVRNFVAQEGWDSKNKGEQFNEKKILFVSICV